jgi:putative ATPase
LYGSRTILFVDEIHRFNKGQQDALLPAVEDGRVVLIGATTENPYFEVNSPLISRSRVFKLEKLDDKDVLVLLQRALRDQERGLGSYNAQFTNDALKHIVRVASGDARSALNALELAVLSTPLSSDGTRYVDLGAAEESIQQRALGYDKTGDNHYDTISAFIKSMRGSDPDAAIFWLAKMIYAGEDPRFIARRLIVHASEDVGMADPHAMLIAQAAAHAVEFVGMPEARIPLAEATIYIACAPKSNACVSAIDSALNSIAEGVDTRVPIHLRDASYKSAAKLGHGEGYVYPHNCPGGFVEQQYMPDGVSDKVFYRPTANGLESRISSRLSEIWPNRSRKD